MDKELLQNIFNIPAMSDHEKKMGEFIIDFLKKHGINYEKDSVGNIYNIGNQTPLLSAHQDTVQDTIDARLVDFIRVRGNYISGYGVIGGDDKCGIYIILDLLRERSDLNFIFSVGEEIGGKGIKHFVRTKDIQHIPYGIVLDRRGANDIICEKNDYGTKAFEDVLAKMGQVFGYKPAMGTFSDADYLNEQISVTNLSVGYYNAHMKSEFVKMSELKNARDFVWYLTKHVETKFAKPPYSISPYKNYYRDYYDNDYYGSGYEDEDYNLECAVCKTWATDNIYIKTLKLYVCETCFRELMEDVEDIENKRFIDEFDGTKDLIEV